MKDFDFPKSAGKTKPTELAVRRSLLFSLQGTSSFQWLPPVAWRGMETASAGLHTLQIFSCQAKLETGVQRKARLRCHQNMDQCNLMKQTGSEKLQGHLLRGKIVTKNSKVGSPAPW
ncbi:MAG: hypothetical protein J7J91_05925 [Deltaproteobacteria bacterium]|nr:hypothetical protein [Deltaproteobacteria bacterium]